MDNKELELHINNISSITNGSKMIEVRYINNVECKLISDNQSTLNEVHSFFTFTVPNYQMLRKQNPALFYWDGKIKLTNKRSNTIPYGLLPKLWFFCKDREYKLILDKKILNSKTKTTKKEINEFVKKLDLKSKGQSIVPYDHQFKSLYYAIQNKRSVIESATSSGKSLLIYMFIRWCIEHTDKKVLLIVPNIGLVNQMKFDFDDYGNTIPAYTIVGGKEKDNDARIYISTWQSLMPLIKEKNKKYFEQFETVITDEVHTVRHPREGKALLNILKHMTKAHFRMGCTGTLRDGILNKLQIVAMFGEIHKSITSKQMMDKGLATVLKIKSVVIKYPDDIEKKLNKLDWIEQQEFMEDVSNPRQKMICDFAMNQKENTLILFRKIEHGTWIYEKLLQEGKKKIFYIDGSIKGTEREQIRLQMENEKGAILVASFPTFSTGMNVKNLHNIIFASSTKSKIRVLQSIGRTLRLHKSKIFATLIDFVDSYGHFKKHYISRKVLYEREKFQHKELTCILSDWCKNKNEDFF
jgi:superfamily II DNA or RNA helicase